MSYDDLILLIIKLESLRSLIEKSVLDEEFKDKFREVLVHSYLKRDQLEELQRLERKDSNKKILREVKRKSKKYS